MINEIDVEFRFYSDTPSGKDPDLHSPTLRRYHQALWSKGLPNGGKLELIDTYPNGYLYHNSHIGEFRLSSDSITHSYRNTNRIAHIINQVPAQIVNGLFDCGATIGAYILFPGNRIERQMTINAARGFNSKISDRFDITLECIRLYYENRRSPLTVTLSRYGDFFALFQDFKGYVDFFLLQDLVAPDYSEVRFHIPYECFEAYPLPKSKEEYLRYQESVVNFVKLRALRMIASLKRSDDTLMLLV